jgi:hypothetical protein
MTPRHLCIAVAFAAATPALAQVDPCELIKIEEVNAIANVPANKMRTHQTKQGIECSFLDSRQNAVLTTEVRNAKLPKAELDIEAENLQKIYRTSVKPVEIGDGGFWLNSKHELFFRKGKHIVRVVMAPAADAKITQARTETVARLIESRLK